VQVSSFRWRKAVVAALVGAVTSMAAPAAAQLPTTSGPVEAGDVGARKHFERALELYRSGRYAEALPELEQAAELDPHGKDLFFNLSLVHEKLGQLPEAVAALERFRELETDPKERERARLSIERLRGAEQAKSATLTPPPPCPEPAPAPPVAAATPAGPNPVLIGAASLAAVSVIVGSVFGAKALSDDVSDSSTSASFSAADLRERGRRAEREALVADLAFAVALASGATFAGVWVLTPSEPRTRAAGFTLRGYF
jgi:tetratricopeptide (TPR) repeat protein